MPVKIIRSTFDLPPCGNCSKPLLGERPAVVYLFDGFEEIGEEIKTGEINLHICPNCGLRGWVFGGFLVVDKGRWRGVFVSGYVFGPREEDILNERLEDSRPFLDAPSFEKIKNNIVWVAEYQDIFEVLCEAEDLFHLEVASGISFRKRQKIDNPSVRAVKLVEDALEIGALILRREEGEPEFIEALMLALKSKLNQQSLPDDVSQKCQLWHAQVLELSSRLRPKKDNVNDLRSGGVDSSELTEPLPEPAFRSLRTAELNHALTKAVAYAMAELADMKAIDEPASDVSMFKTALYSLFEGKSQAPNEDIEILIEKAAECAPPNQIRLGDEIFTTSEAVRRGARERWAFLSAVGYVALCTQSKSGSNSFLLRMTQLLVRLQQKQDRVHDVARFLGFALCGEFFLITGMPGLSAGAYAAAAISAEPADGHSLKVPQSSLNTAAFVWQRLGQLLDRLGNPEQALLCARNSTRHFELVSDIQGVVESSLDGIRYALELPASSDLVTNARAVLNLIQRLNKGTEGGYLHEEAICVSRLGEALLNCLEAKPTVLLIEGEQPTENLEGNPDLAIGERLHHNPVSEISAEKNNTSKESSQGLIVLTRFNFKDRLPFIARLRIIGIEWFDCFMEAIRLSERHRFIDLWFHLQGQLIERSLAFVKNTELDSSEFPLFFYEEMIANAKRLDFGEPPPRIMRMLLPVFAGSMAGASSEVKSQFYSSEAVSNALDFWRADFESGRGLLAEGGTSFKESVGVQVGELFEAAGRYDEAKKIYLAGIYDIERHLLSGTDKEHVEHLSQMRTQGLYRAARAGLKHFRLQPEPSRLRECVDMIECFKARSVLRKPLQRLQDRHGESPFDGGVSSFFRLRLNEIREFVPPATGILMFALLPESKLNEGFWFSTLIDPQTEEILHCRFLSFDEVYEAVRTANQTFNEAREALSNQSLDNAHLRMETQESQIDEVLSRLGNALIPPEIVVEIEERSLRHLVIVPEAYLFDAPLPALRVSGKAGCVYLFQLNQVLGGLAVNVIPNWTLLAMQNKRNGMLRSSKRQQLTLTLAEHPSWRRVTPLFGVKQRVQTAIDEFAGQLGPTAGDESTTVLLKSGARVVDFLQMLRQSQIGVFLGHGEVDPIAGSILIATDGPIGEQEVIAGSKLGPLECQLLILGACSGVDSQFERALSRRDLAGAHIAMLRGGVRYVIGSIEPLFPVVVVRLLETILREFQNTPSLDDALCKSYMAFSQDSRISSPVFWGHIIGLGNGFSQI